MTMSKGEREELQRLVRNRARVLKSAAKERSAKMLAEFESEMAASYSFDHDEVWKEAYELAQREVAKAQQAVARRCAALGIPAEFAPGLSLAWVGRSQNAVASRRAELRRVATTRIAALESEALLEIDRRSLESQEALAVAGLTSDAAKAFLERLPPIETLMPALSFEAIAGRAEPSVAEQLISPNAVRQRRFRERQRAALRNVGGALRNDADDLPEE